MMNPSLSRERTFGTREWFNTVPMPNIPSESLGILSRRDESLEAITPEDIANAYKTYRLVQSEVKVAYLHRKNERLNLKDNIIKHITKKYNDAPAETAFSPHDGEMEQERLEREMINMLLAPPIGTATEVREMIEGAAEMISAYLLFKKFDSAFEAVTSITDLLTCSLLDGRLYQPVGAHNWLINASWMLAHLHKESKFLVCSEILDQYLYRETRGYEKQISGFAREIAIALKYGYQLNIVNGQIEMTHRNPIELARLTLLDMMIETKEYCRYYQEAIVFVRSNREALSLPASRLGADLGSNTPAAKRPKR